MSPRNDPLHALQWHWGEAYTIYNPEPDVWLAIRRDDHTTLHDTTPTGLRDRILADYSARPVARQDPVPPAATDEQET